MSLFLRSFRRLPLFLRVVFAVGSLFFIVALIPLIIAYRLHSLQEDENFVRAMVIFQNLAMLSMVSNFAFIGFVTRFRQPKRWRFPLTSWQSQAWIVALAAAPALCGLTLAAIIPPTQDAVLVITFIGGCVPLLTFVLLATVG